MAFSYLTFFLVTETVKTLFIIVLTYYQYKKLSRAQKHYSQHQSDKTKRSKSEKTTLLTKSNDDGGANGPQKKSSPEEDSETEDNNSEFSLAHKDLKKNDKKAISYSKEKLLFSIVVEVLSYIETMIFLYFNFMPGVWSLSGELRSKYFFWIRKSISSEIVQALIFGSLSSMISSLIKLPTSIYFDFVIEAKYGFNQKSPLLFVTDYIKSLFVGFGIGLPFAGIMLYIILKSGPLFYIYTCVFILAFQILLTTIYPDLIQPLFNKVEPLAESPLKEKIHALASKLAFPLSKIFVIDGSKRSNHSNAYLYGFFNNKRIVLFDTLQTQCTDSQILAILAHEIGHWYHGHIWKSLLVSLAITFFSFWSYGLCRSDVRLYHDFGFSGLAKSGSGGYPVTIGLVIFFTYILSASSTFITFFSNLLTRKFERQADCYAAKLQYAQDLIDALAKLQSENLGINHPFPPYQWLTSSHPTIGERIDCLKKFL